MRYLLLDQSQNVDRNQQSGSNAQVRPPPNREGGDGLGNDDPNCIELLHQSKNVDAPLPALKPGSDMFLIPNSPNNYLTTMHVHWYVVS